MARNRPSIDSMVLLFTNTKGGVGKSTLACHLALYLFDLGIRTALVDSDPQASSAEWVSEAEKGVTVRQANTPEEAAEAVVELRASHDFVICDSPGNSNETARTLMLLADLAIFPVGPSILDLRSLAKATSLLTYARRINDGKPEGRILLNKVKRRDRISRGLPEAAAALGVSIFDAQIRDLQAFRDAAQQATTVSRMKPFAMEARLDMEAFYEELLAPLVGKFKEEVANG